MSVAIQKASQTLVDRSRHGDQNATGIIVEIRKNRDRGNPQADASYRYMMDYIRKNPPAPQMSFGSEGRCPSFQKLKKVRDLKGKPYGRFVVKFVLNMGKNVEDSKLAAHILAQGRAIDWVALRDVLGSTPSQVRPAFRVGYQTPQQINQVEASPVDLKMMQLGYILGLAEKVQKLKMPDTPISDFSPRMGWELGE
jgi:hypothetical protein